MTDIILLLIAFYLDWKLALAIIGLLVFQKIQRMRREKRVEEILNRLMEEEC